MQPDRSFPWAIWVADALTGSGHEVWTSGEAIDASYPYMARDTGAGALSWAADNTLVFAGEQDGWQHLYRISANGGAATLLTPGKCEVSSGLSAGIAGIYCLTRIVTISIAATSGQSK